MMYFREGIETRLYVMKEARIEWTWEHEKSSCFIQILYQLWREVTSIRHLKMENNETTSVDNRKIIRGTRDPNQGF